ncbi:MAG: O-antigen ligase family protein [Polyangiales bacterium]
MRKQLVLPVLFFLTMTAEVDGLFPDHLWTPMRLFGWLVTSLPIKLTPLELVCWVLIYQGFARTREARVPAMSRMVMWSFGGLAFAAAYGLARGGEFKPIYTQVHGFVVGLTFALAVAVTLEEPEDHWRMVQALVYAALYRAVCVFIVYLKFRGDILPACMTTHEDTALFVTALLALAISAFEARTPASLRHLMLGGPVLLLAIQLNNRRLAWVALAAGLITLYFLVPSKTELSRQINRAIKIAIPLVLLYVLVGWGRTERIFKPLAAFASMGAGTKDDSTIARDNEDMGMVLMTTDRPLLGTGLGHEWLEVDASRTVPTDVFPMYHYSPHNSVLAMFAFCGALGFAALWMAYPVAVHLLARTYRAAPEPMVRAISAIGICGIVVCMNQLYGDMGMVCLTPMTIAGTAMGAAMRMPWFGGLWAQEASDQTDPTDPTEAAPPEFEVEVAEPMVSRRS